MSRNEVRFESNENGPSLKFTALRDIGAETAI
jgi:hypothetical protein